MRSPFPGMDPYLEEPAHWPDVHHELICVARELLLHQVRPAYFVNIDERRYLADETDEAHALIVPDARVRQWELDVRELFVEIIERKSRRVVTVLEILSPPNKVTGSIGRRSYEEKKHSVFAARINLVEIDLLREGIPMASRSDFPQHEYMAQVWRWGQDEQPRRTVWPMGIREPLKVIPVPVRPEDPEAALDLQQMLDIAYDRAGYELRIKYGENPVPPLPVAAAEWARAVIDGHPAP